MKKRISLLLLGCALCLLLCACGSDRGYEKGKSFSAEFLRSVSMENMPLPMSEQYALNDRTEGQESLKFETDRTEFNVYVRAFVEYMQARDDIYYFGIQYYEGSIAEIMPHEIVYGIDESFRTDSDRFEFCYSLTGALIEGASCSHKSFDGRILVTLEYESESGVAYIRITENATFGSDCIDDALLES